MYPRPNLMAGEIVNEYYYSIKIINKRRRLKGKLIWAQYPRTACCHCYFFSIRATLSIPCVKHTMNTCVSRPVSWLSLVFFFIWSVCTLYDIVSQPIHSICAAITFHFTLFISFCCYKYSSRRNCFHVSAHRFSRIHLYTCMYVGFCMKCMGHGQVLKFNLYSQLCQSEKKQKKTYYVRDLPFFKMKPAFVVVVV